MEFFIHSRFRFCQIPILQAPPPISWLASTSNDGFTVLFCFVKGRLKRAFTFTVIREMSQFLCLLSGDCQKHTKLVLGVHFQVICYYKVMEMVPYYMRDWDFFLVGETSYRYIRIFLYIYIYKHSFVPRPVFVTHQSKFQFIGSPYILNSQFCIVIEGFCRYWLPLAICWQLFTEYLNVLHLPCKTAK